MIHYTFKADVYYETHITMKALQHNENIILSYYRVRQTLGYLGLALPILLVLGSWVQGIDIYPSISDFFHGALRDVFVGCLCAIAMFLICYKGHDPIGDEKFSDNSLATTAGIFALGVAFFPNETGGNDVVTLMQYIISPSISPYIHYLSALGLFIVLGLFCLLQFSKTKDTKRRAIYYACGWTILISCVFIAITSYIKLYGPLYLKEIVIAYKLVFWIETIGIWAFAISWLVKGHAGIDLANISRKLLKKATSQLPQNSARPYSIR